MSFESIITTIRRVGMDTPKGQPIYISFRKHRSQPNQPSIHSNAASHFNSSNQSGSEDPNHDYHKHQRTIISNSKSIKDGVSRHNNEDEDDDVTKDGAATILVGADYEMQQEFSRIVAMVPHAFDEQLCACQKVVLLPWNYGKGAPVDLYNCRGITLLISAHKNKLTAHRLEIWYGHHPEKSCQFTTIGSIELSNNNKNDKNDNDLDISSIHVVKTGGEGWCLAVCNQKMRNFFSLCRR